ncbi:MAG: 4Fe-4S dicluster domain-containing protein [Magnetococcales bacterium]|nr:4Fe-4S dicluster domain-containing protein [Magnetococcales bacterium]
METFTLYREHLGQFLDVCQEQFRVQIPVSAGDGRYRFSPLAGHGVEALALEYHRTLLPPKKYFLLPEETICTFDQKGYHPVEVAEEPFLLFGLHPCDLHGLRIIDQFFSTPYADSAYQSRRKNALIVGLGCLPDDKCFCATMNTQQIMGGYDLFFWDLGERFYIQVGSEAGHGLIHKAREMFHDVVDEDRQDYLETLYQRRHLLTPKVDVADLSQIMEANPDCAVWDELGAACFACGACTMVCPTCTCYDIFDRVELDGSGRRCRQWDSCLFRDFDRIAGEVHFRSDRSDRVKNRFFHKEVVHVKQHQRSACVGCGRCQEACPAGIDVVSVLSRVHASCA